MTFRGFCFSFILCIVCTDCFDISFSICSILSQSFVVVVDTHSHVQLLADLFCSSIADVRGAALAVQNFQFAQRGKLGSEVTIMLRFELGSDVIRAFIVPLPAGVVLLFLSLPMNSNSILLFLTTTVLHLA